MNEISPHVTDAQCLDTLCSVLRDPRRCVVVERVADRDPPIPLDELATAVVDTETASGDRSPKPVDEVAAALHHVHLPKLDEAGVLDYDAEATLVRTARPATLAPFLQALEHA